MLDDVGSDMLEPFALGFINFLAKFQGGRLFQCGRLLVFAKLCVILEIECNVILEFECNVSKCKCIF